MSSPTSLTPIDPAVHFTPDDAIGQWNPQQQQQQTETGFPAEVPRHPPHESPEWSPQRPQEAPLRVPTPMPDWSPSSATDDPPTIDEPQNPTKHDSPPRPDGKHDLGDEPDERSGPAVEEDPRPEGRPTDEGGDIEEPGAQNPSAFDFDSAAGPIALTPSGRLIRPTTEEAFY